MDLNSRGQFSTSCHSVTKNGQETYRLSCMKNWALRCSSNCKHANVIMVRAPVLPKHFLSLCCALFFVHVKFLAIPFHVKHPMNLYKCLPEKFVHKTAIPHLFD
jgi:hypothetical protein